MLDVVITSDRLRQDPSGREFVEYLQTEGDRLGLGRAVLYYDFPTYSDYETVSHKPDALLLSQEHGIVAIRFVDGNDPQQVGTERLLPIDESLGQFCSILIGRLLKSRVLRNTRA